MKKIKRLLTVFLVMSVFFSGSGLKSFASNKENSWTIEIQKIDIKEKLYTTEEIINYDGSTEIIEHKNEPSPNSIFAIITLNIEKYGLSVDSIYADKFKLEIQDDIYSRMIDDSFLSLHNYNNVLDTNSEIKTSTVGTICFEISDEYLNDTGVDWIVSNGDIDSIPYLGVTNEIPIYLI